MNLDFLLSPPISFLVCFGVSLSVYYFGSLIGAKSNPIAGKLEPYACGEDFEAGKFEFGYRKFFIAAIFFTIMHVAVLTVATVPGGVTAFRALAYLVAIAASILTLYLDFD